jgi:hypothetical protein
VRNLRTQANAEAFSLAAQIVVSVREIRVFRRAPYFLSRYDRASKLLADANT